MKKIMSIFLVFSALMYLNSCESGNERERKEAAKEYMKKQTIHYSEPEKEETSSENELVAELSDKTFDQAITEGITLVDFWAVWCKPCKLQGPIVDEIAGIYKDRIKVAKVDVDQNKMISQRFQIESIPTLIIFKDGQIIERLVGLQDKATLESYINKYVK